MGELNIVALPSTNLYLQGRSDKFNIRRGIAPVKKLIEHKIDVALASDNIQDPFNPFGNANLLQIALLAAHGCHMGQKTELEKVYEMITYFPAQILGIEAKLDRGCQANLIVLSAQSVTQAIIEQSPILERIYKGIPDGKWLKTKGSCK